MNLNALLYGLLTLVAVSGCADRAIIEPPPSSATIDPPPRMISTEYDLFVTGASVANGTFKADGREANENCVSLERLGAAGLRQIRAYANGSDPAVAYNTWSLGFLDPGREVSERASGPLPLSASFDFEPRNFTEDASIAVYVFPRGGQQGAAVRQSVHLDLHILVNQPEALEIRPRLGSCG